MDYTLELCSRKEGMPYNEFPFVVNGTVFYQDWNRLSTGQWSDKEGFVRGGPKYSQDTEEKHQPCKSGFHSGKYPHYPTDEQFADSIRMYFYSKHDDFVSVCEHCKLVFPNADAIRKHHQTYSHQLQKAASLNLPAPEDPLHCTCCAQDFATVAAKSNHVKSLGHRKKAGLNISVYCVYCDKDISCPKKFTKHCKMATAKGKPTSHAKKKNKMYESKKFECKPCRFRANTPYKWDRHIETEKHRTTILPKPSLRIKTI